MRIPPETRGRLVTVLVAVAVGVACYAIARTDPWGEKGSGLPATFSLDLKRLIQIDPELIRYEQTSEFSVPLDNVRNIAVGAENRIYVAGDRAVLVFSAEGRQEASIPLSGEPSCLAVGGAEHAAAARIYVGVQQRIELFEPDGRSAGSWEMANENSRLTSIAVAKQDVFVADAGNRLVLRFDVTGKHVGTIGAPDPDRDMPTFVVPSAFFDVAVDADDLLYVANPGRLRIETLAFDGQLQTFWGQASPDLADFFGCCNPSQFAVLPSGQFVTSEKGIPRVKIYSAAGEFECVVAGPEQLGVAAGEIGDPRADSGGTVFDVATDQNGRVLVLDQRTNRVRVFTLRKTKEEAT